MRRSRVPGRGVTARNDREPGATAPPCPRSTDCSSSSISVLLFPAAGLALLRRQPQPKGSVMKTTCSSYATGAEADAAVRQLLADGMPPERISVISGRMTEDHRAERVGAYAGEAATVGAYAGMAGSTADAMGSFASASGEQRRGSFGDIDRD